MKKFISLNLIGISLLSATSRADMPVIDFTTVAQLLQEYQELMQIYSEMQQSAVSLSYSLLKLLSAQIAVADDALANQKDINNSDKSSAAAVANLTLASLSNLNTQMSAEIRAANAHRASQTQNNIDQKQELNNLIGKPYKRHDPSKFKSCVGDCK